MRSRDELRQAAQSMPEITLDSATLLALLDAIDSIPIRLVPVKAVRDARPIDPEDERCACWLFAVLQRSNATAKAPNFSTWARDVRLMRERDDRTHKEICELFLWSHKDSFWCANILSPKNLRKNWDRLVGQRGRSAAVRAPAQLGKQGQATAQNAARWLEEHGHAT